MGKDEIYKASCDLLRNKYWECQNKYNKECKTLTPGESINLLDEFRRLSKDMGLLYEVPNGGIGVIHSTGTYMDGAYGVVVGEFASAGSKHLLLPNGKITKCSWSQVGRCLSCTKEEIDDLTITLIGTINEYRKLKVKPKRPKITLHLFAGKEPLTKEEEIKITKSLLAYLPTNS